jgi:hypothetical protein
MNFILDLTYTVSFDGPIHVSSPFNLIILRSGDTVVSEDYFRYFLTRFISSIRSVCIISEGCTMSNLHSTMPQPLALRFFHIVLDHFMYNASNIQSLEILLLEQPFTSLSLADLNFVPPFGCLVSYDYAIWENTNIIPSQTPIPLSFLFEYSNYGTRLINRVTVKHV